MSSLQLGSQLDHVLEKYREERNFNPTEWVDTKCEKLAQYLRSNNIKGCVLSVSGGIDSAVTLGLLHRTHQLPNSPLEKIIPLSQPIHSSDWAQKRAQEVCNKFKIPMFVINQTQIMDNLSKLVDNSLNIKGKKC